MEAISKYLDQEVQSDVVLLDPPTWQMMVPPAPGATPPWLGALLERPTSRDSQKHPIDYLAALGTMIRVWHLPGGAICWGEMNQAIDRYVTYWYSTQAEATKDLVLRCIEGRLSDLLGHLDGALIGPFETDDHGKELRRLIQSRDELESLQLVVKSGELRDGLDKFDGMFKAHGERWASVRIKPFSAAPMCELFHALHAMWPESPWIHRYIVNSSNPPLN